MVVQQPLPSNKLAGLIACCVCSKCDGDLPPRPLLHYPFFFLKIIVLLLNFPPSAFTLIPKGWPFHPSRGIFFSLTHNRRVGLLLPPHSLQPLPLGSVVSSPLLPADNCLRFFGDVRGRNSLRPFSPPTSDFFWLTGVFGGSILAFFLAGDGSLFF